jgi:hypothetical protein
VQVPVRHHTNGTRYAQSVRESRVVRLCRVSCASCVYSMGRAPVANRMAMRPTAQMWVRLTLLHSGPSASIVVLGISSGEM